MKILNWTRNRLLRRAAAAGLAALLLLAAVWMPSSAVQSVEELEKKKEQLEEKIEEREEIIEALRKDQKAQEKLIELLGAQIDELDEKLQLTDGEIKRLDDSIAVLQGKINGLNREIAGITERIRGIETETQDKEALIALMQRQLMERLRRQYIEGPVSNLQLLLSSPDLSSFLNMAEYIKNVAEHDARLRESLEREMADMLRLRDELTTQTQTLETRRGEVEAESAVLETERAEQRSVRTDMERQQEKLDQAQQEVLTIIAGLRKKTSTAEALLEKNRREAEEFDRMIDSLAGDQKKSGAISPDDIPTVEGRMVWPVPYSNCRITSLFGDTAGRDHSHKGLDISCPDARTQDYSIIAALEGKILKHGSSTSMGNYVVIYHGYYPPTGKEIQTTYMHLKSIDPSVKDGAQISAKKIIGIMGTTGRSTGPHLHFQINEISANGTSTPVDPLKYVSNPYK
ncbi:MAG: peptidoglycan DD-metalloendopeptidase family protein [Oscillospiraceae bacterium]|jgi:murein DD-endopeptidase MepM/ murein hydrolase activator NlpD|nr:peptidoglycan DD-metalloendopeptidase family protein [Oscillospiraceae bacterium]